MPAVVYFDFMYFEPALAAFKARAYALSPRIAPTTASVTCRVVAFPPRSGVCSDRSAVTFFYRPHELLGGGLLPEVLQHHGGRPEGADRVGDALAGYVESRTVDRLEHRWEFALRIEVGGRRNAKRAGERGGEI